VKVFSLSSSGFRSAALLCLVLGVADHPALAQDRPASITVLGGVTTPLSDARDAMGTGWNMGVAGALELRSGLGVRADYQYGRFGAAEKIVDVTLGPLLPAFMGVSVRAKSQMHAGSLDVTWTRATSSGVRVYVMAGPTLFRRRVQLTATGPQGIVGACEPQWLQCRPEVIGFDRWLGIKESDDLGFNVGAGLAFRAGLTAMIVVEARYFHVSGPSYRSADGRSASASARFLPVSVGLRF
jgi:opacity protein-like surface antigen